MGWSSGKVYNIVRSLEQAGLVKTELIVEGGRVKRKVYPTSWVELF